MSIFSSFSSHESPWNEMTLTLSLLLNSTDAPAINYKTQDCTQCTHPVTKFAQWTKLFSTPPWRYQAPQHKIITCSLWRQPSNVGLDERFCCPVFALVNAIGSNGLKTYNSDFGKSLQVCILWCLLWLCLSHLGEYNTVWIFFEVVVEIT